MRGPVLCAEATMLCRPQSEQPIIREYTFRMLSATVSKRDPGEQFLAGGGEKDLFESPNMVVKENEVEEWRKEANY